MASKLTTAKRQSYTVSDKLRIIQFAEQNGNRAAEREFGVSESNVRLWRKSKENLEKMPRLKRANRGKKAAWPELEIDLLAWITEKRNNGLAILPSLVRLKALELVKEEKYRIPEGQFKAGNHWCQCFMKRNGLSLRQKTTLAQRLPDDHEEKIVQFHRFIINRRKEHSYPLHLIANMDEFRPNEGMDRESMAVADGLGRRRSLLVYDAFEAHVTDPVKAAFKRENTDLAVIPGGLTSLLQPLDVSLTLSLLERPKAANRKWPFFPRAAKSGQIKLPIFTLPSAP